MTWCSHCSKNCLTARDDSTGSICCAECGKVIIQDVFSEEATFVKTSSGQSRLAGTIVRSIENSYSDSHRRTLDKGNTVIYELIDRFGIQDVSHATSYYQIAVERSFTKGRRTSQVAAACLYIACREKEKPFLLIEFSSYLTISVYELGGVYLQLCKLLSLEEHSFIQKPIDPSLFMHRFTSALIKGDNKKVLHTALHIVSSMKRDWMQTGRKPSGICAAALYVSTLTHGFTFSKSDIVKVVHICEATLTKRLIEFENTESGSLTIEEFSKNAEEYEKELQSCKQSDVSSKIPGSMEVLCEHKGKGAQSGYGLCRSCYLEFCGGLGGTDPPAFQHAEMERLAKACDDEIETESTILSEPCQETNNCGKEICPEIEANENLKENGNVNFTEPQSISPTSGNQDTFGDAFEKSESWKDMPTVADEIDTLSETLSDIDDSEVSGYLNNEEESRYKKIIWEEMNKEYMQEQAAKEAAAAAARKIYSEASDDVRAAQELAAAAAAAVANSREKRRQKRALEAKNAAPAQTAAEATHQMLTKKRLSSKINYDVLKNLFEDDLTPGTKKSCGDDRGQKHNEKEKETNKLSKIDEEEEEEDVEDYDNREDDHEWHYNKQEEIYDYNHDDDDGGWF